MREKGDFSVLMAVYIRDDEHFLDQAILSIYKNELLPSEVIVVQDGPVSLEIVDVLNEWSNKLNIKIVQLDCNAGLGRALNMGLDNCSYELIARFDADDINRPNRFSSQFNYMCNNPDIDIISSWVQEFEREPSDKQDIRKVPRSNKLLSHSKRKSPFNHPAVMFRKKAIINAGKYGNEFLYEDYALWMKLLNNGCKGDNIQEVLVDMRFSENTYMRRGGGKYLISEIYCQFRFYQSGYINFFNFLLNISVRACVRLLPNIFRKFIYRNILRRKK